MAANAITREQDRSAKECIPCTFEVDAVGQPLDGESMRFEPRIELRRLALTFRMGESRTEKAFAENEPGIRSKNEIGQPRLRRHQLNVDAELDKRVVQIPPLL